MITAHYMHEAEREAARRSMPGALVTDAFVHGQIEEERIEQLRAQGLFVEVHDDEEPLAGDAGARGAVERSAAVLPEPVEDAFYILRLRRPLLPGDHERLAGMGVEVLERVAPVRSEWEPHETRPAERREFKARLAAGQLPAVRLLDFVHSARLYGVGQTPVLSRPPTDLPQGDPGSGLEAATGARPRRIYDVVLHRPADTHPEDRDAVLAWLRDHGVPVTGTARRKIRVELDSAMEPDLRALHEVALLDEYAEPQLLNDHARRILGVDPVAPGAPGIPQTGKGQVVGIADTGIDQTHKDFSGRIRKVIPRGRPGDASDSHGHGTHVAGSVAGTGAESNGEIRGVAPEAEIVFQSICDASGKLALPVDVGDLLQEAYDEQARIHNNSWGAKTGSQYRSTSFDVDDFVCRRRDMLVVIAAGTEGTAVSSAVPLRAAAGYPDWLSIGAPATSKNALVVGASRSSRTSGGWAADTWNARWPDRFRTPDGISVETISGSPECLAGFSSRGPCMDDRVKPDLVAPGTDILSTRPAKVDDPSVFWAVENDHYAYMGGTSMAAPLVAGCAALVREYYVDERGHTPSAALLKATLVNGSRWLSGSDAVEGHKVSPNFHQGFGAVHLPTTIPSPGNPRLRLEFFDPWDTPAQWLAMSGLARQWDIQVNGGTELRVCLVYTDLPASGLQNRLNLFVAENGGSGRWVGNQDLPYNPKCVPDPYNNVQVVRVPTPASGEYRVKVSATSLLQPQDFALVVTGDLASGL
jgi:subtilisin family serine protease